MTTAQPRLLSLSEMLPHERPPQHHRLLLLYGIRRTGAHGLNDAATGHAFMTAFGSHFRRPLLLLRALMAELSSTSANAIQIAPCCCPRMTSGEAALLEIVSSVEDQPERATLLLADLLGVRHAGGPTATAHLLALAFREGGQPLA
ncbi:DUF6628 family protein [Sphingomonas sp. 3-13AW]|jgi:hypothetical protein|uniref:DUF6628 family protein n=1 Tax=Sphingomonas sp. 3-13AW TaxID=3050450 RepID=UPI003BB712F2